MPILFDMLVGTGHFPIAAQVVSTGPNSAAVGEMPLAEAAVLTAVRNATSAETKALLYVWSQAGLNW